MLRAIWRYLKAFGLLITGQIDAASKALNTNVYVIRAGYDEIVREKVNSLDQMKQAIGELISNQEKKIAKLYTLNKDIVNLEKKQAGAAGMAKKLVAKHGGDAQKVKADPEYAKCQSFYRDFTSTLEEKRERAEELQEELESVSTRIDQHRNNMMLQKREIDKIKEEKADIVADIITAKEEERMNNMMAGISTADHTKQLEQFRDIRRQRKASAKLSRELAGLESKQQEEDFLVYAETHAADTDFDNLIGLSEDTGIVAMEAENKNGDN